MYETSSNLLFEMIYSGVPTLVYHATSNVEAVTIKNQLFSDVNTFKTCLTFFSIKDNYNYWKNTLVQDFEKNISFIKSFEKLFYQQSKLEVSQQNVVSKITTIIKIFILFSLKSLYKFKHIC